MLINAANQMLALILLLLDMLHILIGSKDILQIFHKLDAVLGQAYAFFAAGKDFESQFVFNILDDSAQTLLG